MEASKDQRVIVRSGKLNTTDILKTITETVIV